MVEVYWSADRGLLPSGAVEPQHFPGSAQLHFGQTSSPAWTEVGVLRENYGNELPPPPPPPPPSLLLMMTTLQFDRVKNKNNNRVITEVAAAATLVPTGESSSTMWSSSFEC